jgi:hypothetical protein
MTQQDFLALLNQMKRGSVPKRLIFLWRGSKKELERVLEGIEMHWHDVALEVPANHSDTADPRRVLEEFIRKTCEEYDDKRSEPSALMIENAILLPRYGCDLTFFLRHGISPRSAVIFVLPAESRRQLPPRIEALARRNTNMIVLHVARQLGVQDCIIEA